MIDVWETETVMCESRTFNQWIPLVSTSETFQKDAEVMSCCEIPKVHKGFRIHLPGFVALPYHLPVCGAGNYKTQLNPSFLICKRMKIIALNFPIGFLKIK